MRAAIYRGAKDVRIEEILPPTMEPGEVIVDVEWCGLCGTDLHLWESGPEGLGNLTKTNGPMAISLGHEFCGRIRAAEPGSRFKVGDKVMIDPRRPCRSCSDCRNNKTHCCATQGGIGYNRAGGFAEQVAVPETNLYRLPDHVSLDYAAIIEPLAVAVRAVRLSGVTTWDEQTVLIIGGGPVGYSVVSTLKGIGAKTVIVTEPTLTRREQISKLADFTLDPLQDDVVRECLKVTDDVGVDLVIDCAGSNAALESGFRALKTEGLYLNLALFHEQIQLPAFLALTKNITFKNSMVYNEEDFDNTVNMFSQGKFTGIEKMVTARISIDDIVKQGFEQLIHHKDDHIKILVSPKGQR